MIDSTYITDYFNKTSKAINGLVEHKENIVSVISEIEKCYLNKKKVLVAGNGGSCADAEHFAGELIGRYKKKRKPLKSISLTADSSVITCIANDFGYEYVFSRQLNGLGKKNDLVIVFSTSGNSQNIIETLKVAKSKKIKSIALLGNNGGKCKKKSNYEYIVPSKSTELIQEVHHIICHYVSEILDQNIK